MESMALRLMEMFRLEVAAKMSSVTDILDLDQFLMQSLERIIQEDMRIDQNSDTYSILSEYV